MYRASLQQISRLLDCLGEFLIFFLSYKLKRGRADQRLSHRRQTWDVQLKRGQADQRQAHQSLTRHLYWNKD